MKHDRCSVISDSLQSHGIYSPWNSLGRNTWVGSLSLLQGIFPTQGLNPDLLHCRWILYQPSHKGSPRILEWVAYPFSRRSSQPSNWTGVSCIAGRFFANWAIREAHIGVLICGLGLRLRAVVHWVVSSGHGVGRFCFLGNIWKNVWRHFWLSLFGEGSSQLAQW